MPSGYVAISLGRDRMRMISARTAAQRRLRFLRHRHSLGSRRRTRKRIAILQGIEPILTGKWTGRRRWLVRCFMA